MTSGSVVNTPGIPGVSPSRGSHEDPLPVGNVLEFSICHTPRCDSAPETPTSIHRPVRGRMATENSITTPSSSVVESIFTDSTTGADDTGTVPDVGSSSGNGYISIASGDWVDDSVETFNDETPSNQMPGMMWQPITIEPDGSIDEGLATFDDDTRWTQSATLVSQQSSDNRAPEENDSEQPAGNQAVGGSSMQVTYIGTLSASVSSGCPDGSLQPNLLEQLAANFSAGVGNTSGALLQGHLYSGMLASSAGSSSHSGPNTLVESASFRVPYPINGSISMNSDNMLMATSSLPQTTSGLFVIQPEGLPDSPVFEVANKDLQRDSRNITPMNSRSRGSRSSATAATGSNDMASASTDVGGERSNATTSLCEQSIRTTGRKRRGAVVDCHVDLTDIDDLPLDAQASGSKRQKR